MLRKFNKFSNFFEYVKHFEQITMFGKINKY